LILDQVSPLLSPSEAEWPVLRKLADRLQELGYTDFGVSKSMGLGDHCTRHFRAWPAHVRSCRRQQETSPCALLTAFFLIEESVAPDTLKSLLGGDVVALMRKLNWIDLNGDKFYFRYFLYPLSGVFLLTDGPVSNPNDHNQVYHLGSDSHFLARLAPRPRVALSLDHCTGSGVQAVLAARHSQRVWGLDVNPRALQFARVNARLNGLENAEFLESDCYQNVQPELLGLEGPPKFDLITANPPFVPTPETLSLCRGGGVSGEDITEKILRGLPEMLSANGVFSMITNIPIFTDQTFFERCENWLNDGQTWGMAVLSNHKWTLESYIMAQQTPVSFENYGSNFQLWLDAYESVGLEGITNSQVYLFRSAHAFRIDRRYGFPSACVAEFIEAWIASLRAFDPSRAVDYRLHPGLEKIWWLEDQSRVYAEWKPDHHWWQPQGVWLEGAAARALHLFRTHPQGLASDRCDPVGLSLLLADHLVTLGQESAAEGRTR
jgi:carbamoyltransferase